MQEDHKFQLDTFIIESEADISNHIFPLTPGDRIYFSGDLGAGKSTFIRFLLRSHFHDNTLIVRSPTYTYYQKYSTNVYHFDLYRLESPGDLLLIGAFDILHDPNSICLIEWPEILGEKEKWTKKIYIKIIENGARKIEIIKKI